jgi:hypothetical protein
MKAHEFITEKKNGKVSKRQQQSTRGMNIYSDSEQLNTDYTSYRLGMAVAGADGKTPVKMDSKSWVGKKKTTHPYSQAEQDMLKDAYKAVGADYTDLNHGDMRSKELEGTYTVSPVSNWMKTK